MSSVTSRMRRGLATVLATAALAAGLVAISAVPASASTPCPTVGLFGWEQACSTIYEYPSSVGTLAVGNGWNGSRATQDVHWMGPGDSSTQYLKNVTAFYVPNGYSVSTLQTSAINNTVWYGAGWHTLPVGTNYSFWEHRN